VAVVTDTVDVKTLVGGGNVVRGGNTTNVVDDVVCVEDGNSDVGDKEDGGEVVDEVSGSDDAIVDEDDDCEAVVEFENRA
jgi:hypothetical protein